jgi:hypothetical protein
MVHTKQEFGGDIELHHGMEIGWYFAAAISIPLVIWFFVTHLKEFKGKDKTIKKPTHTVAE